MSIKERRGDKCACVTPDDRAPLGAYRCAPTIPGFRMLTFSDGTQSGVVGLDDIFAAVHSEGMPAGPDTAREIVERLAASNYIAPSVRQRYCDLIEGEYESYVEHRASASPHEEGPSPSQAAQDGRRTGLLSRILGRRKRG